MSENQVEQKSDIEKENSNDKKLLTKSPPPIKYEYEILSEDYTNFDLSFKLIVIGDSGVGKSCLTNNAVKNIFEEAYNATVGFEFFTFNVKMCEKVIKLQIWDTCGQELYRSLITNFYRNSSLAIMVYAINDKATFENIEMWLRELRTHSNPDAKVFLIGNKVDLEKEREVTTEQGENYCKQNKIDLFMESSAKTGLNTQNIFLKAAELLFDNYNKYQNKKNENENEDNDNKDENKVLNDESRNPSKGCC
jgi:small GTP-binding protein